MRSIAVVSDAVYPFNKGGKEVRYYEVVSRLADLGFDVTVYTMKWWSGGPTHVDRGVRYRAICPLLDLYAGRRRSFLQAIVFSLACLRLFSADFDVLEADHMPYLPLFPLRLVAWAKRVPMVVTWHEYWGAGYWREYLGRSGIVAAGLEAAASRLPDVIVAVADETRRRLVEAGVSPTRVAVVEAGIDRALIAAIDPADEQIDVLFVGRLLSNKNVDVLLEALALLRQRDRRPRAVIVGDGPERSTLEALSASLGLQDQVRFAGAVDTLGDVYALMKSATVFALPSTREGFGITVLEALACGAVVVTSDHPDNQARLLVDHQVDGWVCEPGADALAAGLAWSLDAPCRGGRDFADWSDSAADVARLYTAAAART
jgi:glycosyltransferase involved in cell wall biosynthesis